MATATSRSPQFRASFDHIFFSGLAAIILVTVFLGFAQTYYLAGVLKVPAWKAFGAPPHPLIVNLHGAVFSSWVLLLIAQTSLVATGRVDLHRRLGLLGFALAFLMIVVGTAVICEQLARLVPKGDPRISGAATQVLRLLGFAVLVYCGYRSRKTPSAHKRLMLIATITLLPAAFVRWPVLIAGNFPLALACCLALLVLIACYELWSSGKINRATLWGSALVIVTNPPVVEIFAHNTVWFRFAAYMQTLGDFLR